MIFANVNHPPCTDISVFHTRPSETCSLMQDIPFSSSKIMHALCFRLVLETFEKVWFIIPGKFLIPKPWDLCALKEGC